DRRVLKRHEANVRVEDLVTFPQPGQHLDVDVVLRRVVATYLFDDQVLLDGIVGGEGELERGGGCFYRHRTCEQGDQGEHDADEVPESWRGVSSSHARGRRPRSGRYGPERSR